MREITTIFMLLYLLEFHIQNKVPSNAIKKKKKLQPSYWMNKISTRQKILPFNPLFSNQILIKLGEEIYFYNLKRSGKN